jgi:hypothetical protein
MSTTNELCGSQAIDPEVMPNNSPQIISYSQPMTNEETPSLSKMKKPRKRNRTLSGPGPYSAIKIAKLSAEKVTPKNTPAEKVTSKNTPAEKVTPKNTPAEKVTPKNTPAPKKKPTLIDLQESINDMRHQIAGTVAQAVAQSMEIWQNKWVETVHQLIDQKISDHMDVVKNDLKDIREKVQTMEKNITEDHELDNRVHELEASKKKTESENISRDDNITMLSKRVEQLENTAAQDKMVTDIVAQHQKYLEHMESTKRAKNLIIYGITEKQTLAVEEPNTDLGDVEKVSEIFQFLDMTSIKIVHMQRLGKTPENNASRPRPILVSLESTSERNNVLDVANKLKQGPETFRKIYIKKDVHPAIRREYERLRKVEKEEREKPQNQGKTVKYEQETRQVTVNGLPIDSFHPQLF